LKRELQESARSLRDEAAYDLYAVSSSSPIRCGLSSRASSYSTEQPRAKRGVTRIKTADREVIILRAELRSREEQMQAKDQLLASQKQVIACKDALIMQTKAELQRYRDSAHPITSSGSQQLQHNGSRCHVALALDKNKVLDQVFSFVGGGEHLFVGGVNRKWRGRYLRHCVLNSTSEYDKKFVTRHSSVLMTESRLKLAMSSCLSVEGRSFSKWCYTELVCVHSLEPQKVLTRLRLHGVPWHDWLCSCAALHGKLQLLQWLRSFVCPWDECRVLYSASRSGSIAMLEWLLTVTAPWTDSLKLELLDRAAWFNNVAAAEWLRAQGAPWPTQFTGQYYGDSTETCSQQCWSLSAVQWAVASGSGWLDWRCADYAAVTFTHQTAKQHAAAVLEWAHASGCPCTCGK
jgi:hypothetical protein